jgi:3-hydroxyisobutyrate dehydrogenase-like beta-hydroxyacid dehydrogenase
MTETERKGAAPSERVGLLGLGIIGSAWADHYEAAGVLAAAWNRSPKPGCPRLVADPSAVARAASVVHIVVSDPSAVDALLSAIQADLGPKHLVIQSTTIDPESSSRFAKRVKASGASYVEAPFMGSRPAAEQRKIVFLPGGDRAALERADAVLAVLAAVRRSVGTEPQAAALKLSFNLHVAISMQGICEGLNLARQAQLSDDAFFQVLQATGLWSGFHGMKEPKLRTGDFAPQFSIKHMLKDVRLATGLAAAGTTPLGIAVRKQLEQATERGFSDEDMSALIKVL